MLASVSFCCYFFAWFQYGARGGMAEWLKAAVLKTVIGVSLSGVRIPLPPPAKSDESKKVAMERWLSGRKHVLAKDATG